MTKNSQLKKKIKKLMVKYFHNEKKTYTKYPKKQIIISFLCLFIICLSNSFNKGFAIEDFTIKIIERLKNEKTEDINVRGALWILSLMRSPSAIEPICNILLENKSGLIRSEAARALGEIGNPKAVSTLLTALNDPSILVQCEVAISLGKIKDQRAVQNLCDRLIYLKKNQESLKAPELRVITLIIEALGELKGKNALDSLIWSLDHVRTDEEVEEICKALAKIGDKKAIGPIKKGLMKWKLVPRAIVWSHFALYRLGEKRSLEAIKKCTEGNQGKKYNALRALGETKEMDNTKYLISALSDSDSFIRMHAIRALRNFDCKEAIDPLINILLYDHYDGNRKDAAELLGTYKDHKIVGPILQVLEKEENCLVRSAAVKALGWEGNIEAIKALKDSLNDICTMNSAVYSLGEIRNSEVTPALIEKLKKNGGISVVSIAEALEKIGDKRAIKPLEEKLNLVIRWNDLISEYNIRKALNKLKALK